MEAQKRVQDAVTKLLVDLDVSLLRSMQQKMYQCSANCCGDMTSPLEKVTSCVDKCSVDFRNAQNHIANELTGFQGRLERCALQCEDKIRDKMTDKTTDKEMKEYEGQFNQCVLRCADDMIQILPDFFGKMKKQIKISSQHGYNQA